MQQRMENEQFDQAVIESEKERDLAKVLGIVVYCCLINYKHLHTCVIIRFESDKSWKTSK